MGYIKDYLKENKNKSFDELHFTEVDAAILALLILFDVGSCVPTIGEEGITFHDAFKKQIELHGLKGFGLVISSAITRTLNEARTSKRYKNLILCDGSQTLDENLETQSTFMSVILPNKTRCVICGSTDDSIVGWKENLNLLFNGHVPCLENSKDYLNLVGEKSKHIIVIGHSKGGMESLYATAFCKREIFNKIIKAYSFDGTGYHLDVISEPSFRESLSKMVLFVPNSGIVGRIFFNPIEPFIIPSKYRGINQHDLLSWEIKGTKFKRIKEFTVEGNQLKTKIDNFTNQLSEEEKKDFVMNFFKVLEAGKAKTLSEVVRRPYRPVLEFINLPKDKKELIGALIKTLANDRIIAKELFLGFITIPITK